MRTRPLVVTFLLILVPLLSMATAVPADPDTAESYVETYHVFLPSEGDRRVELVVEAHAYFGRAAEDTRDLTVYRHDLWLNPVPGMPRGSVPVFGAWPMRDCIDLFGPPEEVCVWPTDGAATVDVAPVTDGALDEAVLVGGNGCIRVHDDDGLVVAERRLGGLMVPPLTPGGSCPSPV